MTPVQLRSEILKALNEVADDTLADILNYLKSLKKENDDNIQLITHLSKIFTQDKALLKKLAE
jgi:hypothetical protein